MDYNLGFDYHSNAFFLLWLHFNFIYFYTQYMIHDGKKNGFKKIITKNLTNK
jgi:hypothetical protein